MTVQEVGGNLRSGTTSVSMVTRQPRPETGDVVVARRPARADVFAIGVVPQSPELVTDGYEGALGTARELARGRLVDAWFTCDHTHFVRIARHRQASIARADLSQQ